MGAKDEQGDSRDEQKVTIATTARIIAVSCQRQVDFGTERGFAYLRIVRYDPSSHIHYSYYVAGEGRWHHPPYLTRA